ncbi:hypothetical protein BLNAU_3922 [Blattamonas nauphoetae]|uniref:Uncharacterized protein n=1 Tax=Blattamonas nauphoetae TaxID=2049346 RepID=A0ABQ9YBP7_9EUKA|nr:hypothetical protein BLNAU_3922 [Blattamonas nauphoetae]
MKTELHISAEQNALEIETENGIDSSSADEDWQLSIFRIRNSTVSLTSLCLNSEGRSSLIASVSSSFVTVSESDIRSNGMNSPRVCSCTNHLYGTACVDMNANVMGSLLSLNSSFSSCLTETPTHLSQHFQTTQQLSQSASFKLCTFKDCTSSNGGAIFLQQSGSLLVEECSFKTCRTTGPSNHAGAIFFNTSTGDTFIANSSSFVGCSATTGGSLLLNATSSTLINCVFINSTSLGWGGSVFLSSWDAVSTSSSITNCLFEKSRTTATDPSSFSGGALYFVRASTIHLIFVNFRGNKATQNPGNDIMFALTTPLMTSETIVECSSTSASPRLIVYEEASGTDDHLPNPTTTVTHDSCDAIAIDSNTAKFTLKMSKTITGTVLVLIDNSGGTRSPTGDQAPNIGRVLSFSFDNSDSSSCRVSLGERALVQTPLYDYSVITTSFVGSVILSANFAMDPNEKNALITISGYGIPSGIIHVTLSDNTVLDFEFRPNQTTSAVLTVPLTENSPKLRFGETYKIVSARSQTLPTHRITLPFLIEFIVPNPPRLTTLKEPEYDSALKTVHIGLEGVDLEGTHTVTLSVNGTETVTIDVVFSSSKGQLGGILFDTETPSNVNMSYNTRYEIVGIKTNEVIVLCLGNLSFKTIAEPTRLLTMTVKRNDEVKKTVTMEMTGRVLDPKSAYHVGLSISGTLKHTVSMTFNSSSGLWEGSALLYPSKSAELEYGQTYEVSSFQKGGNTTELLFEANSIEMIPESQRLVKVKAINADGLNSTTLTLSTLALTNGAEYTLELKGTPLDHFAANALLDSLAGSGRLSKTDSNQIESMKNEDTGRAVIIESAVTVSTGSAPSSIVTFCNSSSNNVDGVVKRRGGVELTADLAIAEWDGWDRVGTTRLVDPSMHARLCDLFQLCWLRALVDWNPNELDCARGVELLLHSMFPFVFLIIVVDCSSRLASKVKQCSSFGGIFPS